MYFSIFVVCSALALWGTFSLVRGRKSLAKGIPITVIMGDPSLPDKVKKHGGFSDTDFKMINNLKATLGKLGEYDVQYLDAHAELIKTLSTDPPKFVLNLCDEGFMNSSKMELHVPALLEMLNIPYTGSGPTCLATAFNKGLAASYVKSINIPVPRELFVEADAGEPPIPDFFPVILKPSMGDGSIGITTQSVVHDKEELIHSYSELKKLLPHTPILIQEFLSGREFSVGVIGNAGHFTILPLLEVDYSKLPPHLPPLLTYESKWNYDTSPYWNDIEYKKAEIDPDKGAELIGYALKIFKLLECRDYAVFDFREDSKGRVHFLEVNPNAGWGEGCTLDAMAKFMKWDYKTLLRQILKAAHERWNHG